MDEDKPDRSAALRGALGQVGRTVSDRVRQQLDAEGSESQSPRETAAAVLKGLVGDASHTITGRVRDLTPTDAEGEPQSPPKAAAAAFSGLVNGVGHNVSDLVRTELGAARSEVVETAKAGARGAGLLGAAAATGNTTVLFTGIALWRGLGTRIGLGPAAVVVAGISGVATAVLATNGMTELAKVQRSQRKARQRLAEAQRSRRPARSPRPPQRPDAGPDTGVRPGE